jgi:Cytosine deaminase and related metal-dependent hydrolases
MILAVLEKPQIRALLTSDDVSGYGIQNVDLELTVSSYLLTNGYVVTVDAERRVLPGGWVRVEGDSISAIGSAEEVPVPADRTLDMRGMVVMPGLINGHNHHWGSLFKNTGDGLLLEPWLDQVTLPLKAVLTPEDLRTASYLGVLEQLRTGTTCSLNHLNNENDEENIRAIIEPVLELGGRQLIAKELRDTPNPVFSTAYPPHEYSRSREEELALAEHLVRRWDGAEGRIHMGLAIETGAMWLLHNSTSDEIIQGGVELAQRYNLRITNHCSAGTSWLSIKELRDMTGGGDVDYLVRVGALVSNWVMAHCLWLTDREIDHMARAGASAVSNPVSNAYSADGIAPLRRMFDAGINVGLGTDGAYVNCSPDMVEQMKFAILIQNVTHLDPAFMTAERAIEMATIGSAKALGLDHLIGSLEVGKRADIVAFDLDRTHITVPNRPVSALVFSAHGTDVDTVMVNGRLLLRDGELVEFAGEKELRAEARGRAADAIQRAGIGHRIAEHWRR